MNSVFLLIVFILSLMTNNYTDCLFAKIGKSITPSEDNHINECGLNFIPKIKTIIRSRHCFIDVYPNITFIYPNYMIIRRQPQSRASFGTHADWAEAPWAVHLAVYRWLQIYRLCSGTLITLEWVLTAAHCFEGLEEDEKFVINGGDPLLNTPQERKDHIRIAHPNYKYQDKTTKPYDIALIKVDGAFTREIWKGKKYQINPVCLPVKKTELNRQIERATLYGFGMGVKHPKGGELDRVHITLIDHYDFKPGYNNSGCKQAPDLLCAKIWQKEPRFCRGDSGGGLLQKDDERDAYVVIGVANSYWPGDDRGCFDESKAPYWNFFTSVPRHIDWIHETIKNN